MSREQYEVHWKDYYEVLGIQPSASLRTIRRVWQRLSQIYHPDVAGDAEVNSARMQELNEAYEVLSDPQRRAKYDQAYQARGNEAPRPSAKPADAPASPPPPPTFRQAKPPRPEPEEPEPTGPDRGHRLTRRGKLVAAAGAIGVAVIIGIGVLPALLRQDNSPAPPQPSSFNPAPSTPQSSPSPRLTPTPSAGAAPTSTSAPTPGPAGTDSPEATAAPTPASPPMPTSAPRDPILVMSADAEKLGFIGFQVSGNPWMVDFSSQCQEAPCLRSGALMGSGFSSLWLNQQDLPDLVRTISFDFKAASPACCASLRILAGSKPITVDLPKSTSWTRVEVPIPEVRTRQVAFEWQFWTGPVGVTPADGFWIDNIQFQ